MVLLTPGYGPLFSAADLSGLGADALVVAASTDDELPGSQVDALIEAMPDATESMVVDGGHYVFLRTCTDGERSSLAELCVDDPSVDRERVRAERQAWNEDRLLRQVLYAGILGGALGNLIDEVIRNRS